tara:strand:- start:30 stop:782 length:753 start_codon:yes stop_codon:yes gene_type:complete
MKGVGVGYESGMKKEEYKKLRNNGEICEKYSFRGILSEKWGCNNINYACMGSSNMRQFRNAMEHFKCKPEKKTVVLWGITSIFRHEVWVNKIGRDDKPKGYRNVLYGHAPHEGAFKMHKVNVNEHLEHHFDEENEIKVLCNQMDHWNLFFESIGVENYWFDTFNHHNYPYVNSRMLFTHKRKRDLLSILVDDYRDDTYHASQFSSDDSVRISDALKLKLVNPYSSHPTKETHVKIAELIDEEINLINNIR